MKKLFWSSRDAEQRKRELRQIYEAHAGAVRRTLTWMVEADRVDDLQQEVFVRVWRGMDKFEGRSALSTWIRRITYNVVFDYRRHIAKEREVFASVEISEWSAPDGYRADTVSDWNAVIKKVLATLSAEQLSLFVMYYKEEWSIEEIAAVVGIPAGTVKSRLRTLRETVRETLRTLGVHDEE